MQHTLVVLVEAEVVAVAAVVGNMNIVGIAKIVDLTAAQFLFYIVPLTLLLFLKPCNKC